MITLINWGTANLLVALTMLSLVIIPVVALVVAFRKRSGADADKEAFDKAQGNK